MATTLQDAYQVALVSTVAGVLIEEAIGDALRFYAEHGHDVRPITASYNPCDGMYLLADDTGAYHLRRCRSGRYVMQSVCCPSMTLVSVAQMVAKDAGVR